MGLEHKIAYSLIEYSIYSNFTIGLLQNLIVTRPQTTSQAQVKLILSLSTLSTHAMNEREQDSWHLNRKENTDGEGIQISCERLTSMRTVIGERMPSDRYDVRSRDCH